MKRFYLAFVAVFIIAAVFAQAPASLKYQTVVRNTSGQLITNTQVTIQIAILKGSIGGSSVYTETFSQATNNFGIVNLNIGTGTVISGNFSNIDWGADSYFIKVSLNGTEMGTSQLLSVPYALYAKKAETISGNAITGNENVFRIWDKDSTDDVTLSGEQTITGNKTFTGITTVPVPVNATDAVNKAYVDNMKSQIDNLQIQVGLQDIDGNYYDLIKIGTQLWMIENLRTKRYSNGDSIDTTIPYDKDIGTESEPKYQWDYEPVNIAEQLNAVLNLLIDAGFGGKTITELVNLSILTSLQKSQLDSAINVVGIVNGDTKTVSEISEDCGNFLSTHSSEHGLLYTWYSATDSRNICPAGWHVPTDSEWGVLLDYLTSKGFGYEGSGDDIAKSMADTWGWDSDPIPGNVGNDIGKNNSSGFRALPAGYRYFPGSFHSLGRECAWWSSTEESAEDAYSYWIRSENNNVSRVNGTKLNAHSVRCIRDF